MKQIQSLLLAALLSMPAVALDKIDTTTGPPPRGPGLTAPQGGPGVMRVKNGVPMQAAPAGGNANAGGAAANAGGPGAGGRQRPQKNPAAAKKTAAEDAVAADEDHADAKEAKAKKSSPEELDYLEMVTGDKLYGKIYKEEPDNVILLVNEDMARLKVPKAKIRNMNFSMGTRLKALEPDDYAGQYKVGLWAMEKNMYPQAIKLFEELKGKDDVPDDISKQLGRAYEQRGQLDKALDAYNEYVKGHVKDLEIAALAAKLDEQIHPKVAEAAPAAAPKNVDGLEADGNWMAENWADANKCTVQPTADKQNKMIVVQSPGGTKDKIAFSRYAQPLNLSESTEMVFKIFNAGETPINMAAAFVNAQSDYHESKQIRIAPKSWLPQSFRVDSKTFKTTRNNFEKWDQGLEGRDHIIKITFLVYGQKASMLYIDSLFFK